ncbi:transcriptional regulator [Ensifer sp. NM-2]|nr:transcriptional regulator [Ensifer sp. NM-2]
MNEALDQLIDGINVAWTEQDITDALCGFTERCGLAWFAYVDTTFPFGAAYTNYPEAWQQEYMTGQYLRFDPVMAQARRLMRPFTWENGEALGGDLNVRQFWRSARKHGIGAGLTIPIRSPFGNIAVLTFAGSVWPDAATPIDEFKAIAAVAYVHARVAMCQPGLLRAPDVALSARETECLAWASLGKSMAMTADLIGMQPCTVKFYLDRARTKLGAYNLVNAVYQAARQQLI